MPENPADYTRADAGVLYMYKFDWEQLYPALAQVFEEMKPYLKEETPLFALPIAKGIAFGENPKDARQSFGTQRCELIAEAIFLAQNKPKDLWTESVMEHLKGKDFDLDRFYLNPNSSFVYGF